MPFKRLITTLMILLAILLAACDSSNNEASQDQPVLILENTPQDEALAAVVNGEPITRAQLDQEINARAASLDLAADPITFQTEVLEAMIIQVLIEQYAAENELIITDEAIQAEIDYLREQAANNNQTLTDITGYPADMTATLVRRQLISQAVVESIIDNLPTTALQIHARHILVADEQTAQSILDQLAAGADFAELAEQHSLDPATAPAGGDLGWIAVGDLIGTATIVEEVIFSMDSNTRWPEPVASTLGFHIIEVLERDENHPLDAHQLGNQQQRAFQTWIDQQRALASITRYVGHNAE